MEDECCEPQEMLWDRPEGGIASEQLFLSLLSLRAEAHSLLIKAGRLLQRARFSSEEKVQMYHTCFEHCSQIKNPEGKKYRH